VTVPDLSVLQVPRIGGLPIAVELKRKILLREVNNRIREISDGFGTPEGFYRLICECGRENCEERFEVQVAEYDDLRRRNDFLVCSAHEPKHATGPAVALMPAFVPADPLHLQ
jgi:hypothetical protein